MIQNDITKACMEGMVEVKRSRGRPARRWQDDFKEWAGVDKIYAAYNVIRKKSAPKYILHKI